MVAQGYIIERAAFEVLATISCLIGVFQIYARLLPENRGKIRLVQKWFFPVAFGFTLIGMIVFIDYRCVFGVHSAVSVYSVLGVGSVLPIPGALFWLKNAYETVTTFTSVRLPFQIQPYAIYIITGLHLLCVSILLPTLFALKGSTIGIIFGWTMWLAIVVLFVFFASIVMTLVVRRTSSNEQRIAGGSSNELHRVYRRLIVVSILLMILIAAMILAIVYNYPIREKPLQEACGSMSPDLYRMTLMNYSFHAIWLAIVIATYTVSWLHVNIPLRRLEKDGPTGNKSTEMNVEGQVKQKN
jgi:hypothetical protein